MKEALEKAIKVIMEEGKRKLVSQGHVDTGRLIASLEEKVYEASVELWGEEYGLAQETGIKAENHPFKNVGGISNYIEAITEWVMRKGMESDILKARGIAFAIGKSQSGRGTSKSGTGMHSTNGAFDQSKQGWLTAAINNTQSEVDFIIEEGVGKNIDLIITNLIKESQRNLGIRN